MTNDNDIIKYKGILFKHVKGHGEYAVSQCGLILDRNGLLKPKISFHNKRLIPYLGEDPGYLDIVVWKTWVGPLGNVGPLSRKYVLCRKDKDLGNNHLSNLYLRDSEGKITEPPAIIQAEDVEFEEPDITTYSPKPTKRDKLTADDVRYIRGLEAKGPFRKGELAKQFGIDPRTLNRVLRRESWKSVK